VPFLPRELHDSDRPSSTAQWTTLGRALELGRPTDERIVSDQFAPHFLSTPTRHVLGALRAGGPAVRTAERFRAAGIATSALCRHRFIDTHLLEALPDAEQILLLGAGYDARAYRFRRSIAGRPVFEVDLPPISRRKAGIVAARRDVFGPASVRRVEVDFRTQRLDERLDAAGFRTGGATVAVWEGVAMYLDRESVAGTIDTLAGLCGPHSVLLLDCWQRVGGWRPYDQVRRAAEAGIRLVGEPITFAITPAQVGALLAERGFDVADLAEAEQLTKRYATAGRRCEDGLFVAAATRRLSPAPPSGGELPPPTR